MKLTLLAWKRICIDGPHSYLPILEQEYVEGAAIDVTRFTSKMPSLVIRIATTSKIDSITSYPDEVKVYFATANPRYKIIVPGQAVSA